MANKTITRDEWLKEMETLSPSPEAFAAYVELEQFIATKTRLLVSYRRGNKFATCNGSAKGRCSVIQLFGGKCDLMWTWTKEIPGLRIEQHQAVNDAFGRFRNSLEGSKSKDWETVKVLCCGTERVKAALLSLSEELLEILP